MNINEFLKILPDYNYKVEKVGDKYRICCPFHNDTNTPNLFIYPKTESFYCFACGEGGKLNKLYKQITGKEIEEKLDIKFEKQDLDCKDKVKYMGSKMFFNRLHQENIEDVLKNMQLFDERLTQVDKVKQYEMSDYLKLCK